MFPQALNIWSLPLSPRKSVWKHGVSHAPSHPIHVVMVVSLVVVVGAAALGTGPNAHTHTCNLACVSEFLPGISTVHTCSGLLLFCF